MSLIQSQWAVDVLPTPRPQTAGAVHAGKFLYTIPTGGLAAGDILELGVLPTGAQIVGASVIGLSMPAGVTADIGIMSGNAGEDDDTRTSGNELFTAVAVDSGVVTYLSKPDALLVVPQEGARGIGVKFSAAVPASANRRLLLIVHFTQ